MPSPKLLVGRHSQVGAYYTVTIVTHARQPWFRDPALARIAIESLSECDSANLCTSLVWVVMPEHVHWLLALEHGELGACVQRFKSFTRRAMSKRRSIQNPVWQRGYYDHRLRRDEDLLEQARYIVANPLRRDLAERIEDYPYWWCREIKRSQDMW